MTQESAIAAERRQQVQAALSDIESLLPPAGAVTREQLAAITARLEQLAQRRELFPVADFPPPAAGQGVGASTRYRPNPDDAPDAPALYLNSINPGKTTLPHDHTTWACIVALSGEELNRVYRRSDDGPRAGRATLEQVREVVVRPGQSVSFLPDDIHSIHVTGAAPTLHFLLYGQPLETLSGRIGIDLATGEIVNYNATQMKPGQEVRA
ncbi:MULTISPECIES: cysteine dioxygenase family protein [Achromobacter]|uniref:Cysteine dioxygenase family protein n=1 Tax=Achromobacter denitrificans TaxID=32002 RepID=A0A6N0JKN8_ACHDE|nr:MULTISPECIES: cysteine dioxygenase family protein [Achromobacter]QKQ47721.1 cysteine dioxygenase family protein [Achromobacter denitrificans]